MTKATHQGTCQCCGRTQKLPNGVLSKHGYTVENGWFSGTCLGAGELPFEQSKDLVEGFIAQVEAQILSTRGEIEKLKKSVDAENVWKQTYSRYSHKYVWEQRAIHEVTKKYYDGEEYQAFEWVYSEEELAEMKAFEKRDLTAGNKYDHDQKTIQDVIDYCNNRYIQSVLEPRMKAMFDYVAWQEERIKNWKPAELTPIK